MADKKEVVIGVEVKGVEGSIKSVKDLKNQISLLQQEVENSDIGSEQYKNAVEQLDALNSKLKEVTQIEKQAAKQAEELAKAERKRRKKLRI